MLFHQPITEVIVLPKQKSGTRKFQEPMAANGPQPTHQPAKKKPYNPWKESGFQRESRHFPMKSVWDYKNKSCDNSGSLRLKESPNESNGERISWTILTCIFVGFGIWKREHSGLCDRWQISKTAKRQGIRIESLIPLLKIVQVIFLPLLRSNPPPWRIEAQ